MTLLSKLRNSGGSKTLKIVIEVCILKILLWLGSDLLGKVTYSLIWATFLDCWKGYFKAHLTDETLFSFLLILLFRDCTEHLKRGVDWRYRIEKCSESRLSLSLTLIDLISPLNYRSVKCCKSLWECLRVVLTHLTDRKFFIYSKIHS